jgi:hypothetical protein
LRSPWSALLPLALAAGCTWKWSPPVSLETRTALADVRLAQPLEGCLARALGSAESTSYLGPLNDGPGQLQVHRLRVYVSPVSPARFLDARVVESRCPDGAITLELSGSPKGTTYDAEPEILELRLDSVAEHVVAICRAKVVAFERGHMVDAVPDTCAR